MSRVMLKLKIENPPDNLEEIAALCRKGTNAAVENWLLRQRGLPETEKQAGGGRKGNGLHPSTKLYHAVTAAVPELGVDIASHVGKAVWSNLNAKLAWTRRVGDESEKPRKRADAILAYEDRAPFTTAVAIPAPNKNTSIQFGDDLTITVARVLRGQDPIRLEISLKGMPAGKKRIIRQTMTGELKLSDSQIVQKTIRNGKTAWFFFLSTSLPPVERFDPARTVTLFPQIQVDNTNRESDRPFQMNLPGGGCWYAGDGRYLLAQTMRLTGLRKMIGYRYRNGNGSGHGRQKVDRAVRLRSQQLRNVRDEFRRRLVNDIVRQCERHQAGTLVYREPTGPAKRKCWFERNELEFDWTRFLIDLKNSAAKKGIAVKVEKLKYQEVKDAAA
jgi:hypothetical protein